MAVNIIIDQSASVVAKSEISVRAKSGEKIPEGWAFGPDGKITTDAATALKGTMAPAGKYKGFGMGLFVEIMSACLTGSNLMVLRQVLLQTIKEVLQERDNFLLL